MSRRRHRKAMSDMNVVPYIDVMLVLLVIFMVTAPMLQTGVQVDLPDADAKPVDIEQEQEPLYISISKNGQFSLNKTAVNNAAELTQLITTQSKDLIQQQVYIRADNQVSYDLIMRGLVAAQQAGIQKIGLLAEPELEN